jgi:surfactin synthase thioesterase subunit
MVTKPSWYRAFVPRPAARACLYALPFAGGNASAFRRWADHLPPWIELRAVQMPGRLGRHRQDAFTTCDEAVESLAESLAQEAATHPAHFVLFGHSMGAMLCYRLTRLLLSRNCPLPALLAIASWPVDGIPRANMPDPADLDDQFAASVRTIGGMPPETLDDPEIRALTLPVLRADFRLCRSYVYRPEPPLPVPAVVFGGADDRIATPESLAGWEHHTEEFRGLELFEGDHFFLREHVPVLTASIATHLGTVIDE